MKVSYSIFLIGVIVLIVELMLVPNLEDSQNLLKGLVSEDILDKISTLYFFIIIIVFFFGGITFFLEKGMQTDLLIQYQQSSTKPKVKKRSTRSNPLM